MKKYSELLNNLLIPLVLVVLGLILIANPDAGTAFLGKIVGWVLLLGGIVGVVIALLTWHMGNIRTILLSALSIALGGYLLSDPLAMEVNLVKVAGILLLVQGISSLIRTLKLKRSGFPWQRDLLTAVVTCLLGLILMGSPISASRLVFRVCGVVLLLVGAANLIGFFRGSKGHKTIEGPDIIDADE